MPKYGAGYDTQPHGETHYSEWFECEYCGHRWDVNRPQDRCDCEDLEAQAAKEPEHCKCGRPFHPDPRWPDGNGGDLCQMCWEAACSNSWWETCGGLLKQEDAR